MSDLFYRGVRRTGGWVFSVTSRPVVRGRDHVPPTGPCLVAATHPSPYDAALLIRHTPRILDFAGTSEIFRNPLVAFLYRSMNAFPLDSDAPDPATVRRMLRRLRCGRALALFPEGGVRVSNDAAVVSRRIRPGIGRLSRLGRAPVVPCVIIDSGVYSDPSKWLPVKRTRYGIAFGEPICPSLPADEIEVRLLDALVAMHVSLSTDMSKEPNVQPENG